MSKTFDVAVVGATGAVGEGEAPKAPNDRSLAAGLVSEPLEKVER
jgi:hypothetical protein